MTERPEFVFTIGHSTHSADAFVALLRAHGIRQLADVRLIPKSRRHPQFAQEALASRLTLEGIGYRHFPALGGRRRPDPQSVNTAWRIEAFRGYADYMGTPAFRGGLAALLTYASRAATAVMCAEAVWWQCHRRLLSDALVVRGIAVLHVLTAAAPKPHQLSEFARPEGDGVIYPGLL